MSRAHCTRRCNWHTFFTFCRRKSKASGCVRWADWIGCISAFTGRLCRQGRLTRAQAVEMWQDFFQKFHALTGDSLFGEPMYLGGELPSGACAVNELTDLILEAYDALGTLPIPNSTSAFRKIRPHGSCAACWIACAGEIPALCSSRTRARFPMMQKVGATLEEAREYVPIGCYEPGILGREVACTGNGGISLPKAVELALNNGRDGAYGRAGRAADRGSGGVCDSFEAPAGGGAGEQADFLTDWMTGAVVCL